VQNQGGKKVGKALIGIEIKARREEKKQQKTPPPAPHDRSSALRCEKETERLGPQSAKEGKKKKLQTVRDQGRPKNWFQKNLGKEKEQGVGKSCSLGGSR